jgi:hypothetical protein
MLAEQPKAKGDAASVAESGSATDPLPRKKGVKKGGVFETPPFMPLLP